MSEYMGGGYDHIYEPWLETEGAGSGNIGELMELRDEFIDKLDRYLESLPTDIDRRAIIGVLRDQLEANENPSLEDAENSF